MSAEAKVDRVYAVAWKDGEPTVVGVRVAKRGEKRITLASRHPGLGYRLVILADDYGVYASAEAAWSSIADQAEAKLKRARYDLKRAEEHVADVGRMTMRVEVRDEEGR